MHALAEIPANATYSEFWLAATHPNKYSAIYKSSRDTFYAKAREVILNILRSPFSLLRLSGFILHGICMFHFRQLDELVRDFCSVRLSSHAGNDGLSRRKSRRPLIRRDKAPSFDSSALTSFLSTPSHLPAIVQNISVSRHAEPDAEQRHDDIPEMFVADYNAEVFNSPEQSNSVQYDVYTASNRRSRKRIQSSSRSVRLVKLLDDEALSITTNQKRSPAQAARESHFLIYRGVSILGTLPPSFVLSVFDRSVTPACLEPESFLDVESDIDILRDDTSVPEDAFGGFSRRISVATSHATADSPIRARVYEERLYDDEQIVSGAFKEVDSGRLLPLHMSRMSACRRFLKILNLSRTHDLRIAGGRNFGTSFSAHCG